MTLRKVTIKKLWKQNISVKYIPKSEQTQDSKPKTVNNKSDSRKQNKNISQSIKKFANNVVARGFRAIKWIMNCYC